MPNFHVTLLHRHATTFRFETNLTCMDGYIRQQFGEGSFPSKVTFHVYLCSTWSCSSSTKTFFHLSAFFLPACLCFTAAWKSSHRGSLRSWCWIRKWISHGSYGLHGKNKFHHWQNASLGEWPSYNFCLFLLCSVTNRSQASDMHALIFNRIYRMYYYKHTVLQCLCNGWFIEDVIAES